MINIVGNYNNKPIKPSDPAVEDEVRVRLLVQKIKQGSQTALTELVGKYRKQVAALAFNMVGDYDEAADITQNVFVKMNNNIWRYDENKKFYTWLYRITVNASIDYIRKHKRHRHEPLESYHHIEQNGRSGPEYNFQLTRLGSYIDQATDILNDKQKQAFLLRDVEGCKIDDVATQMGIPEATVRWYLHRARGRVRHELSKRCPQLLMLFGLR